MMTDAMQDKTKPCPFCGETILAVAIKCKHCASDLSRPAVLEQEDSVGIQATVVKPAADYGIALLAIPIISTMLLIFWVSEMNLFQSPGSTLMFVVVANIFGTAIVAAMEASKVGMLSDKSKGTYSPFVWLLLIPLMWVLCYPVYLLKRKHYGLTNLFWAGAIVAIIFSATSFVLNEAIETQKAKVLGDLQGVQKNLEQLVSPPIEPTSQPAPALSTADTSVSNNQTNEQECAVQKMKIFEEVTWPQQMKEICQQAKADGQECGISVEFESDTRESAFQSALTECISN